MKTSNTKIIGKTFQKIADIVTPTMGAKGRMAIINDEFGRPMLTDDGVTVAKMCMTLEGFERMVAISMVEAASNTEKAAYDGTTLTVLLTNELYKQGMKWVRRGMHPQMAADKLLKEVTELRNSINTAPTTDITTKEVKDLAIITTKIPAIGDLVAKAYETAGKEMNIIIEHDRVGTVSTVEHTKGMVLDAGYFTKDLGQLCNMGDASEFNNARLVLLSEGQLTPVDIEHFFRSIPAANIKDPLVFVLSSAFNPESLRLLLDTLIQNKFTFQMVFINDANPEELFMDIAAKTNGKIQSASLGTSEYLFEHCGVADKITIELDKTTILIESEENNKAVDKRIRDYKKELTDKKYNLGVIRENQITRRLANLTQGITKIKVAVPTITEYMTLKLKLDDAIGAVKCACKNGIVVGGGKFLYNLSFSYKDLRTPLQAPMKTIVKNSGLKISKKDWVRCKLNYTTGINVKTGKLEPDLKKAGIIDSFDSIDEALKNAVSIAANYLRGYILIRKD